MRLEMLQTTRYLQRTFDSMILLYIYVVMICVLLENNNIFLEDYAKARTEVNCSRWFGSANSQPIILIAYSDRVNEEERPFEVGCGRMLVRSPINPGAGSSRIPYRPSYTIPEESDPSHSHNCPCPCSTQCGRGTQYPAQAPYKRHASSGTTPQCTGWTGLT